MFAYLFPGQGSQLVGMGQALAVAYPLAKRTFEEADEALSFSISRLCFEGPASELVRTENTQPAILTTSLALFRVLKSERPDLLATAAAGHSLGEWSALCAAGALPLATAVRLVRIRGKLMQEAVPEGMGAMSAVLGLSPEVVETTLSPLSTKEQVVCAANFNSTEQTVISGHRAAVERAGQALVEAGAKKVVPLAVSAPFHSPLMRPAQEGLAAHLRAITFSPLAFSVVANATGKDNRDPEKARELLLQQVTSPVRWVESVRHLVNLGVDTALELGAGRVLAGLSKRIDRSLKVLAVEDPETLQRALAALTA